MVTAVQRQYWFNTIVSCRDVSSNAWRVASVIGFSVFVGKDSCYLTYDTLAERSTFSRRAVIDFVKELEAGGWITIHRTRGRRANTFVLTLPSPLKFPNEETRQLADISDTNNNCYQGRAELSSGDDASRANGAPARAPLETGEQYTTSDTTAVNSARVRAPLDITEQCTNLCTDANEQQCTDGAPTVHELVHPKRRKEKITYSPFDAQPATDGVSCKPTGASSKQPAEAPTLVFVEYGTTAAMAWERHWLKTNRKRPPWQSMRDQKGKRGWYFSTEFPPDDAT